MPLIHFLKEQRKTFIVLKMHKRKFFIITFILGPFFILHPAYSQMDVEKATRETDRLGREEIEEKLRKIPEKPAEVKPEEEAPVKKEEQKFFIKKINLVGCESFPPPKIFLLQ